MENIDQYLKAVLATFDVDPPDSDYQAGYLAAYQTMADELPRVISGQASRPSLTTPAQRPGVRLVKLTPGVDGESTEG